ncbi:Uma2 family endonuclease [Synechocystis sp. PCC 7509]|uniref:Uma2 family endonuclease n=1 Tax=Synechocystis sp. PCC 7509 TaxID=927677 RepID=UPI0002ABA5F2|nr:Uma2 family endonuclease [Synechocystis sp. PCC 7509]
MTALTLNLHSAIELTDERFEQICQSNRDLRFERTATGELVIMLPAGSDTGRQNCELNGQLWLWNRQNRLGVGFDSSAGFTLPNGAIRSPDLSWIKQERWDSLNTAQKRKFAPICPNFVAELCSQCDRLTDVQSKMQEYLDNGAILGWLIDPESQVEIYRPNQTVEVKNALNSLSGEDVLPGFELDLQEIWA